MAVGATAESEPHARVLVPGSVRGLKYYKPTMSFFTGMMAAQVAAVFTNPIDVVKIRLQIQGEGGAAAGPKAGPKAGLLRMFGKIASEEGLLALQKGLFPSILRETFYSSIRLSAYEPVGRVPRRRRRCRRPPLPCSRRCRRGCPPPTWHGAT